MAGLAPSKFRLIGALSGHDIVGDGVMCRLVRLLVGAAVLAVAAIPDRPTRAQSYEQAIGGIRDQILGAINRRSSGQKVYVAEFLDEPIEAGCNPLSQSLKVELLQLLTNARATLGLGFDLVESEAEAAGIVRGSWRRLDAQRIGPVASRSTSSCVRC